MTGLPALGFNKDKKTEDATKTDGGNNLKKMTTKKMNWVLLIIIIP